ncbi:hypothetical protein L3X38_017591 [Prunus dulcis]|uniref:Uncharacterized protein n=1 Tax=Prunus dulcis TaxID=3755 RepID=A0AAD4Z9X3_PRUDU|nr:hypothetical protein L3X38_017591 [Prunus dulcis]
MDEWISFLKERTSQETRGKCQKFKEMRATQTLVHRTSRKSFACIEDELPQKSETPDAISRTDVWIYGYEKRKKNEDDDVEDPDLVKEVKKYKKEQGQQKCSIKDDAVVKVLGRRS